MRKILTVVTGFLALNLVLASGVAGYRSRRRAEEVTAVNGSITVKAAGVLNTTIEIYDANDIANAAFDFDILENHREALRNLGFSTVHIQTATGQSLDRPL